MSLDCEDTDNAFPHGILAKFFYDRHIFNEGCRAIVHLLNGIF